MDTSRLVFCGLAGIFFAGRTLLAGVPSPNPVVSTPPVYVADFSHSNDPMPPGVLAWDETSKAVDVPDGQDKVQFVFSFTNIASAVEKAWNTNVATLARVRAVTNSFLWRQKVSFATNFTTVTNTGWATNTTPISVTIGTVQPSCHCTTAQLPPLPWTLAPGTNGQIHLTVDIVPGQAGTQFKTVKVSTDKGSVTLVLRVNLLPPVIPTLSEEERARDLAAATVDRQAVFRGDCAKCHVKNVTGKYGLPLYQAVCAICHDATNRAAVVPDLHSLKTPTSAEFWHTWITSGKPGSLMPAFASAQGGPLNDMQIATLVSYLNATIPSHVPAPAPPLTNAPTGVLRRFFGGPDSHVPPPPVTNAPALPLIAQPDANGSPVPPPPPANAPAK
ncbi:MAG: c-type cytochrome [Verrucomicrobiota bacterium]|jgi:mono/diheme cytochrome c family protein